MTRRDFDKRLDDATHAALDAFQTPEARRAVRLRVPYDDALDKINDALSTVLREIMVEGV